MRLTVVYSLCIASLAAFSAGCGDDGIPSEGVAKVGDVTVTKSAFDEQLGVYMSGAVSGQPIRYEPPDFESCILTKKQQAAAKDRKPPGIEALKRVCRGEYEQGRRSVMQSLLRAEWVKQEADRRGVRISDAAVLRAFTGLRKNAFPVDGAYSRFLKKSGATEKALIAQERQALLDQELTDRVKAAVDPPSEREIAAYYRNNKQQFTSPPRRDLRVVLTKTRAVALEAKQALESGRGWPSVARRYSKETGSAHKGGKISGYAKTGFAEAFDNAVFAAPKGSLSGPLKTKFGWYVFEVEGSSPASLRSLEQSRSAIKAELMGSKVQRALERFEKDFGERYREMTTCANDYKVANCKNGRAR